MCCSCPIGPRAASHGQKLITEGNGKILHLQTVQGDFLSLLATFSASHGAINLICVKMMSIDQLNNGMITSFFTALKCVKLFLFLVQVCRGGCHWSCYVMQAACFHLAVARPTLERRLSLPDIFGNSPRR